MAQIPTVAAKRRDSRIRRVFCGAVDARAQRRQRADSQPGSAGGKLQEAPQTIWREMQSCFRTACEAHPEETCDRSFRIAGLPVLMVFSGRELCTLFTRALFHLQVESFASDEKPLRIELWDERVSSVARPFGDLRDGFAETEMFADGILVESPNGTLRAHQNERMCVLLQFEEARAVGWVRSAAELSLFEVGKPLQPILFAWYVRHGVQPVHGGLVARGDSGVLIGGAGGSGKSTTALACAMAGFSYLADDYTGLPAARGTAYRGYSLYASLWLEESHSKRFASIQQHRIEGEMIGEIKLPFALHEACPGRMAVSCGIRAIVLPRIEHREKSELRAATATEAMLKLAPSSVLQLPFIDASSSLQRIAQLIRGVPCFWLDLGTDLAGIAPCVDQALRIAGAERGNG